MMQNYFVSTVQNSTDLDDNQITAFHPGAMSFAHENRVDDARGLQIGIVSPDGRGGMVEPAEQFTEIDVPFIFDPGQGLPQFGGEELVNFIDQSTWVCVNDYESELLQERTGMSPHEIAERVEALVVTLGGEGSHIYTENRRIDVPAALVRDVVDPTGCGDAYRAGLLYGLMNKLEWETTGRIASLLGAIKIAHNGTQNHRFTLEEFKAKYKQEFGSEF